MKETVKFGLDFVKLENHYLLPRVTSIVLTQSLYDILFQYVITPEKEARLKEFIALLEAHIKSKSKTPFSIPAAELVFIGEGLQELKLLNWMEVPVAEFNVRLEEGSEDSPEEMEQVLELLEEMLTFKRKGNSNSIYVYPGKIVS
ncbi:MAG: hypothetical protein PHP26_00435 [Syntrophomonas sp.]|uniref:hypothetical protein n=1 Tax=Syntrophomonas sp. TaxID=2053627 RepID=UPI002635EA3B|nr:hypothetical protein [Syntrophomonas sp.]MDD2510897.1 hypothetical protein [Syntrophomonas sp.]MDD3878450.1 hypothetical protein [Syntrophomonas sp.]MDD4625900.1 hypothetical protein [Syntrophomonas sp.]